MSVIALNSMWQWSAKSSRLAAYRPRATRYISAMGISVMTAAWLAGVLGPGSTPPFRIVAAAMAIGTAAFGWRVWRTAISTYPNHCVVSTIWRTYRVPRKNIEQFDVAATSTAAGAPTATIVVRLVDGSTLKSPLVAFRRARNRATEIERTRAELNRWLASGRAA